MGRIVVTQYLSLDGVMEAPGPRDVEDFKYKAWLFDFDRGPEGDQFKRDEMLAPRPSSSGGLPTRRLPRYGPA